MDFKLKNKMKKFLMILVVLIGFGISVNAQTYCKINGAYGTITATGIEVQVTSASSPTKGVVNFEFSNSSDKKVNVTYSLSIKGTSIVVSKNVLVPPDGKTMQVSFSIAGYNSSLSEKDVTINISGADCE